MRKVVIVNKLDEPIGLKDYAELTYSDIYRVSALWLTDPKNDECLLTQRKWTKHNDPGKWMAAASGTIEEGDSYEQNMVKEIEEEIGLTGLTLNKGPKEFVDDGQHRFFVQWFTAQVDKGKVNIKIQQEEVEAYRWVKKQDLIKYVANDPDKYVPSMSKALKILGLQNL